MNDFSSSEYVNKLAQNVQEKMKILKKLQSNNSLATTNALNSLHLGFGTAKKQSLRPSLNFFNL